MSQTVSSVNTLLNFLLLLEIKPVVRFFFTSLDTQNFWEFVIPGIYE